MNWELNVPQKQQWKLRIIINEKIASGIHVAPIKSTNENTQCNLDKACDRKIVMEIRLPTFLYMHEDESTWTDLDVSFTFLSLSLIAYLIGVARKRIYFIVVLWICTHVW